jgi:tetratricopeptide (TPR) repeat protein
MTQRPKSLQDLIRRRQETGFVGRRDQLAMFDEQLDLPVDDLRRRVLISIHGVAGVGKTLLVKQFRQRAANRGFLCTYVDETPYDVPTVMSAMAAAIEREDFRLKRFTARYERYEQHRFELEADPGAPEGVGSFISKTAVQTALHFAKSVPVVGPTAGLVDAAQAAEQVDRFRRYLAGKFRDHNDVQLLLTPTDILSPLFVRDLYEIGERQRLTLFFDSYERIAPFLEPWVLDLLEGRYGELPVDLTVTIAGQHRLNSNRWAAYRHLLIELELESFDEDEVRELCAHYGVSDERVIEVILGLSGHLPLLVALLAATRPESEEQIGDPTGDAVERFLKWEDDPKRREAAIAAALPRILNQDVLSALIGSETVGDVFEWLCQLPFVTSHAAGHRYHQVVRSQMLRRMRRDIPKAWQRYHQALADHHEACRGLLGLNDEAVWRDPSWRQHALEETYHRLCAAPGVHLPVALDQILHVYQAKRALTRRWAEMMVHVGLDADASAIRNWGERLFEHSGDTDVDAMAFLTELIQSRQLAPHRQAAAFVERTACLGRLGRYDEALDDAAEALVHGADDRALVYRGTTYRMLGRYEQALTDLTDALHLEPTDAWTHAQRGETYRQLGRYEEALADLTNAHSLEPTDSWILAHRGETYLQVGRFMESLADLDKAYDLDRTNAWILAQRGETCRRLGRFVEALADLTNALSLEPTDSWILAHRGETYRRVGQHARALTDLTKALELEPDYSWALASRGAAYRHLGQFQESLTDLTRAFELNRADAWTLAQRGETYRQLGRYEEALTDLTNALQLDPDGWTLARRGETYRMLGRHEEALIDLTNALHLNPMDAWTLAHRGETYRQLGVHEEALTDLSNALHLNSGPTSAWTVAQRGETYRQLGRYEEALTDLTNALQLDPEYAWALGSRGETYRQLGRYEEALADLTNALRHNPKNAWILASRGATYRQLARDEEALADLTKALNLDPTDTRSHYFRALVLIARGQRDSAQEALRIAADIARDRLTGENRGHQSIISLTLCSLALGNDEEAIRLWEQVAQYSNAVAHIRQTVINELYELLRIVPDRERLEATVQRIVPPSNS